MPQIGESAHFSIGPTLHVLTCSEDLHSDASAQQFIVRAENIRHAAATQQPGDPIPPRYQPASASPFVRDRRLGSVGSPAWSLFIVRERQA
jgi:hypothetical protein